MPEHREGVRFFIDFEGLHYPTKYIISIANKYANNTELGPHTFSGGDESNRFLRRLGFSVYEESSAFHPNIWVEKGYWKDRRARPHKLSGKLALGNALISPQRDKRGADIYRNMRNVKKGDVILHLVDNEEIVGISKVKGITSDIPDFVYSAEFHSDPSERDEPGYLITLEGFQMFNYPINRTGILNGKNKDNLLSIAKREGNVFYNSNLDLREGAYLTAVPEQLLEIINEAYKDKNGADLPYVQTTAITKSNSNPSQFIDLINLLRNKKQVILYGPPGTGKTFQAARAAASFLGKKGSE